MGSSANVDTGKVEAASIVVGEFRRGILTESQPAPTVDPNRNAFHTPLYHRRHSGSVGADVEALLRCFLLDVIEIVGSIDLNRHRYR